MKASSEDSYLKILKVYSHDDNSIIAECALKVIRDWELKLDKKELQECLRELTYTLESVDDNEVKQVRKIYNLATKLFDLLK